MSGYKSKFLPFFCFFLLFIFLNATIGHAFSLTPYKKDNGQTISKTEWKKAIGHIRKKFVRPQFKRSAKEKEHLFLPPEKLRDKIITILKQGGFDWGEKSLDRYWPKLYGEAVKEELSSMQHQYTNSPAPLTTTSPGPFGRTKSYDKIYILKNGSFEFSYEAKGDNGSYYSIRAKGKGLIVYGHKLLSEFLEKGIKESKLWDRYEVYPIHLRFNYVCNIINKSQQQGSETDCIRTSKYIWDETRDFQLPIPKINYNASQITGWLDEVRKIFESNGCYTRFIINDHTPIGGMLKITPVFHAKFKETLVSEINGILGGKRIYNSLKVPISGVFNFSVAINDSFENISDFSFLLKKPLEIHLNKRFSPFNFSLEKSGSGSYVCNYYKIMLQKPNFTVLSDKNFKVSYKYSLRLE